MQRVNRAQWGIGFKAVCHRKNVTMEWDPKRKPEALLYSGQKYREGTENVDQLNFYSHKGIKEIMRTNEEYLINSSL